MSNSSHVIRALLEHILTILDNQTDSALLREQQLNKALKATDCELTEARSQARGWEEKYFEATKTRTAMAERVLALSERPVSADANDPSSKDYLHGYLDATRAAKRAVESPRATTDRERP
ncbi:hypothetical protein [Streptomyces violaceusniger]|uniref:hypothetical protein n=1 Tax=Streptomyces violaceusniger TaxID=68280 RepID=UPI0036A6E6AA